jgi:hypothetical protein
MPQHHDYPYATVPRLWPGGTVVCMASGPSLTKEDADYCRGNADGVIVVNTTYQMAPWADVLIASDLRWWEWHKGALSFKGRKYATSRHVGMLAAKRGWRVEILRNLGRDGLALKPNSLMHGMNTGYRAINLAVHFGAARIVLLGYDMQRIEHAPDGTQLKSKDIKEHWHGDHPVPSRSVYKVFRKCFDTIVEPLNQLGVSVINCTPSTALECFPKGNLRDVLPMREVARAC